MTLRFRIVFLALMSLLHLAVSAPASQSTDNEDGFCKDERPGLYCFANLTGWHNCVVDPKTGKMTDEVRYCKQHTRCACYFGPACPSSLPDPCTRYETPPSLPDSFTFTFSGLRSVCSPSGCQNFTFAGVRYVDNQDGGRYRQDIASNNGLSTYIIPSGEKLAGFDTTWETGICTKLTFPKYLGFKIPSYFSYDNEEVIDGQLAKRWFWFEERQSPTKIYVTMYMYSIPGLRSGETFLLRTSQKVVAPARRLDDWYNETYTVFKTEKHDDKLFKLPKPCHNA